MKLLCFSDIHNSDTALQAILERAAGVDLVIGAGDFCTLHHGLQETIEKLGALCTPALFVPGNNESLEELQGCCRPHAQLQVLHGNATVRGGFTFYGLGGGIPVTPFGSWSWDFDEQQADALLADCPAGAVLISHSPPQGCLDRTSSGMRVGSVSVRRHIVEKKPLLVVCGHIHESAGRMEACAGVPVINAGPDCMEFVLGDDPSSAGLH